MRFGKAMPPDIGVDDALIKLQPVEEIVDIDAGSMIDIDYDPDTSYSEPVLDRETLYAEISKYKDAHKRPMNKNELDSFMNIVETGEEHGKFAPAYRVMAAARILMENLRRFNPDADFPKVISKVDETLQLPKAYSSMYFKALEELRAPFTTGSAIQTLTGSKSVSFDHPMLTKNLIPRRG